MLATMQVSFAPSEREFMQKLSDDGARSEN